MSDRPDLNDAVDELYGTRLALDGVLMLLATSNSEKISVEHIEQLLQSVALRMNLAEKVLKRAVDGHYGHEVLLS